MFGVLFGELFKLMKEIDVDHELARQLWATGNVDARNLAMNIADPQAITPAELDRWALENPMRMCGLYIATLAAEGPHARAKLRQWLGASDERLRAMGWTLLGRLPDLDESFPEDELLRRPTGMSRAGHTNIFELLPFILLGTSHLVIERRHALLSIRRESSEQELK